MKQRSRACELCQKLKAKCEASSTGKCDRCKRAGVECVPAAPRFQRDRIAELEAQVEELTSRRLRDTPTDESLIPFIDARIHHDEQRRVLTAYTAHNAVVWPFLSVADTDLDHLRETSSLLLLALLAFPGDTLLPAHVQEELVLKAMSIFGEEIIAKGNRSLEMVKALLTAAFWFRQARQVPHGHCYQLTQLAVDMAIDIGIAGPQLVRTPPAYFSETENPTSLDARKTWIACFLAAASNSLCIRRPTIVTWTPYLEECIQCLDKTDDCLAHMARIMKICNQIAGKLGLCDLTVYNSVEDARDQMATLRGLVLAWHAQLPAALASRPVFSFWREIAGLLIHEVVLHTQTNKALFAGPYVPGKIGVKDFAAPAKLSTEVVFTLQSLLKACHGLHNSLGQISTTDQVALSANMQKLEDVALVLDTIDPFLASYTTTVLQSSRWLRTWLNDYDAITRRIQNINSLNINSLNINSLNTSRSLHETPIQQPNLTIFKMHLSTLLPISLLSGLALAQGDLAGLLQSQDDLSTLLELVGLVDGLAETLASSSNITIFAPTNTAFDNVPIEIPEGEAIAYKNDTIAIGALLANHVFKGLYPAEVVTDLPTFAQTLLDSSYVNYQQPFSNFTGGQYNGLVKNGADVCVLSGEETISTVTEADIKLGDGIIIHKIDTVLSFGAPFQLFTARAKLLAMNAAVEAAQLGLAFGETEADSPAVNISDFTIFVPNDAAFEAIGSVLQDADQETLQAVLSHHMIENNVIFSTALGNVTVPSAQGIDLTFTVLPDGTAWVNGAKILLPNVILFNGVAHIIDSVLNLEVFDRNTLTPSAPAADRVAFPNASPVSKLPFSSVSFGNDLATYTTPALLSTMAAVATPTPEGEATSGAPETVPTAGAAGRGAVGALAVGAVAGVFAVML
ncbi:hypothetical protein BN1723_014559 [Verticillium longisporum]|uniref:Zn(2)-C6 fungal-type domain-containing protein n=2 Tax=Verticillium longisporum TaxID=100787 RepID=A0A0G4MD36_VERLO|nr:hypothetical protein BN1723_014559 [Verticillium longisporum]